MRGPCVCGPDSVPMSGRFHEGGIRRQDRTARDAPPEKVQVSYWNVTVWRPIYALIFSNFYCNIHKYAKNKQKYSLVITILFEFVSILNLFGNPVNASFFSLYSSCNILIGKSSRHYSCICAIFSFQVKFY